MLRAPAPSPAAPGCGRGSGHVEGEEPGQERVPEVLGALLEGQRGGRDLKDPGDLLRDALDGDGAFAGAVQHAAGGSLLQRQPEEAGGVEAVDGRPAVGAVADVGGDAVPARRRDERRDEPVIARAVHGRRESNDAGRTPCSANPRQAGSPGIRKAATESGSGPSCSAATRPALITSVPDVLTNGLPDPASAWPSASIAARSRRMRPSGSAKSPPKAMCTTPSASGVVHVLFSAMGEIAAAGQIDTERIEAATPASLRGQLARWRDENGLGGGFPAGALAAYMIACTQLYGAITLEVWVSRRSSTSCDQVVFVDHAADLRVPSDTVLLKIGRFR